MTIFKKWSFSRLHSNLHPFFTVFYRKMRKVTTSCLVMEHLAQPQRVRVRVRANQPTIPFHKRSIWLGFSGHGISQYTEQQKVERATQTHLYITLNLLLYFIFISTLVTISLLIINQSIQCKIVKILFNKYQHYCPTPHTFFF